MQLLFSVLGLKLVFGTRVGNTLFALFGTVATVALLANGTRTAFVFLLLAATAFAAKRALR